MKKIIVILILFGAMSANAQWVYQYTASQYALLNKIQFSSASTGYAVGEQPQSPRSVFLKTTNGGSNWINMNTNLTSETMLIEMSFINDNTGYICGHSKDIYRTNNGGVNWVTISVPYLGNQIWNSMQFLDENTGYLAGRYGLSEKTTNGGINWTSMDTAYSSIYDLYFLNTLTGFMGDGKSYIKKTTNGGTNWITTYLTDTLGATYSLQKIDFANNNTGYVVGLNTVTGAIFKTTDNGNTWKNVLITPYGLYCIKVVNNATLYAGSTSNIVYFSTNSGLTWINQMVPTTKGEINSIIFTNNSTGYLTISNEIYKTTNGGVGVINISTEIPKDFNLYQNYPNPFNSMCNVQFSMCNAGNAKLVVYDVMGREVQTLVNESLKPGTYEISFDGSKLPSGVYFYKLDVNGFTQTRRMVMTK